MRLKDRLFPNRKKPKLVDRIKAPSFPFLPAPRPIANSKAGRRLLDILAAGRPAYRDLCREIVGCREELGKVPARTVSLEEPHWFNGYMPPLDAMILYALLRSKNPKTYLEIGSGNSTKMARKAIRDHGLRTRIISIDPVPRAEIDALCDQVIRKPFQDVGEEALAWIGDGDVVFQDGSHHAFTNNDTTVFYTEFLPELPRGIVWGVHDIFLPDDYPSIWYKRFYNEQYVLITYLLAGACGDEPLFPAYYVGRDAELRQELEAIFDLPNLQEKHRFHGTSFWMRRPQQ